MPLMNPYKEHSFADGTDIEIVENNVCLHEFSFADVVRDRLGIEVDRARALMKMKDLLEKTKDLVFKEDQDWLFLIGGGEGTGKSNLAIQIANLVDPDFDIETQMVDSYADKHSYLDYIKKYRHVKYKACVFDEAVTSLFARNSAKTENISIVEMFSMNRQLNHYTIMVIPNFWGMEKDLRERRARSFLYVFLDPNTMKRAYAYFSRVKIAKLSGSKQARSNYLSPKLFFKAVRPNFIEAFPKMETKYRKSYSERKGKGFDDYLKVQNSKAKLHRKDNANKEKKILELAERNENEK